MTTDNTRDTDNPHVPKLPKENRFAVEFPSVVPHYIDDRNPKPTTDRQTLALESIARSLEKMANPHEEITTIPAAGSLAEVAQRLVDGVWAAMHDDGSELRPSIMDALFGGLNAAAALGIVPGGGK